MEIHVGYLVQDRLVMADFYRAVLGFEIAYTFRVPAPNMREIMEIDTEAEVTVLKLDGIRLEFIELKHPPVNKAPSFHFGMHHIALRVASPEDVVKHASSLGSRVRQTFRQDHITYYMEDPEGNTVEVSKIRGTD